jgi:hypothetical protein
MGGKLFTDKLVLRWLEGFGAWSLGRLTVPPQLTFCWLPSLTPPTLVARRTNPNWKDPTMGKG